MVKQFVSSVCMVCLLCAIHSHCSVHHSAASTSGGAEESRRAAASDWLYAERLGRGLDTRPDPQLTRNPRSKTIPVKADQRRDDLKTTNNQKRETERSVSGREAESPSVSDHPRDRDALTNGLAAESVPISADSDALRVRLTRDLRPVADFDEQFFIRKVFAKFGDGNTISYEGFEQLLKTLLLDETGGQRTRKDDVASDRIRNISRSQVQNNSSADNATHAPIEPSGRCLKSRDLFAAFTAPSGHDHDSSPPSSANSITRPPTGRLDEAGFHRACPSLIYTLALATPHQREDGCLAVTPVTAGLEAHRSPGDKEKTEENQGLVWLYATLSVILISLCGLAGVAVIPIMQHMFYQQLLQFFVALAIGTLCGDALLHLLPHAMSSHSHDLSHSHGGHGHDTEGHDNASMWKGLVAAMGIVLLTFAEKFLSLGSEWRSQRQRKKKQVPQRVRVMRDIDSLGSSTVGEKLCKHKYSSYPYCYDEITTEMTDDHHHKTAQYSSKCKDEHNHNRPSAVVVPPSAAGEVDECGDGHKVAGGTGNGVGGGGETEGKEVVAVAGKASEEVANGGDYTVYLREHENTHHGHSHTHGHVFSSHETMSSVAWMVVMGDGLHNFTDGMAIGAAFSSNIAGGFSTAVAVFCHELPHELGDFAVLLKAGMSAKQAVFYNILSSVLCLAGMVLGVSLGNWDSATEWIFAGAAGTFLYIALVDMVRHLDLPPLGGGDSITEGDVNLPLLGGGDSITGGDVNFPSCRNVHCSRDTTNFCSRDAIELCPLDIQCRDPLELDQRHRKTLSCRNAVNLHRVDIEQRHSEQVYKKPGYYRRDRDTNELHHRDIINLQTVDIQPRDYENVYHRHAVCRESGELRTRDTVTQPNDVPCRDAEELDRKHTCYCRDRDSTEHRSRVDFEVCPVNFQRRDADKVRLVKTVQVTFIITWLSKSNA